MFDPIRLFEITPTMLQLSQIWFKNFQYPINLSQKIIFLQIYCINIISHIIDILNFESPSISHTHIISTPMVVYIVLHTYSVCSYPVMCHQFPLYRSGCISMDIWMDQTTKNQSIENFIFRIVAQGFIGSL